MSHENMAEFIERNFGPALKGSLVDCPDRRFTLEVTIYCPHGHGAPAHFRYGDFNAVPPFVAKTIDLDAPDQA